MAKVATDLVSFLQKNPVDEIVHEISIPGRLSQFKFTVKPLNSKEFGKYQNIATMVVPGKTKEVKFNAAKFSELVIINHVTYPNFKDVNLLTSAGVNTPEEYLNKFFLAGELANLSDKIAELSGFAVTDAELEEEAKNS